MRVLIRSRVGNAILAVLGVLYFISATATLAYYIITNWGANGLIDYAFQLALFCAAAGGVFFFLIAADNLRWRRSASAQPSRSTPDRQTAAAIAP